MATVLNSKLLLKREKKRQDNGGGGRGPYTSRFLRLANGTCTVYDIISSWKSTVNHFFFFGKTVLTFERISSNTCDVDLS